MDVIRMWLLAAGMAALLAGDAGADIRDTFVNPPAEDRPHVFWYWVNGNISREGITADLEAMHAAGIGGVMIFNIGGHGLEGPVRVLSPVWRDLMRHAIRKAGELGIEVTLNNSMAGWSSSGGPWITPEKVMQRVTWSEVNVQGGGALDMVLPSPPARLNTYRDIAAIAFPTPSAEQQPDPEPVLTASDAKFDAAILRAKTYIPPGGPNWDDPDSKPAPVAVLRPSAQQDAFVQWTYDKPFPARSLHVTFARGQGPRGVLRASDDGIQWRDVQSFEPRNLAAVDIAFTQAPARFWRVVFPADPKVTRIAIAALQLTSWYRIESWTGKAMFDSYGMETPAFTFAQKPAPADTVIARDRVLDITAHMDGAGRLKWKAPPGAWTIMRFGYTPTGSKVGPAHESGKGLECDKLDKAALELHWRHSLQPWFDDPLLNPLVQYVHVDSYERGAQNWTARLPEWFREKHGYDVRAFLPALAGRVVDSVETSERFLWDFRNTVTDMMHTNYFGHMRELCRRHGKQFSCEPYHQSQFNNVTAGGQADIPVCEAWMGTSLPGPYWMKLGASPAHVYGKNRVGCEAFTSNRRENKNDWRQTPWDMKPLGDAILCGGVNRFILHVSAQQPWTNVAPGMTVGICGQQFHRGNTWWPLASDWTRYLARCQHMLRQGVFVADVLFSCGENNPSTSLQPGGAMSVPRGYDYDVCDPQVIFTRLSVKDGRLTLPDGVSYRLLVLPEGDAMTLPMLRRIRELTDAGAVVVGGRPAGSPSLSRHEETESQWRQLVDEMWTRGRVLTPTKPLKDVLSALGVAPDFETQGGTPNAFRHIHRRTAEEDIYFVANSSDEPQNVSAVFRATAAGAPEIWDPVRGVIRSLPEFRVDNGRTMMSMAFEPRQSCFVVFPQKDRRPLEAGATRNFPEAKQVAEITGGWRVTFDPKNGGPSAPVVFDRLADWAEHADPAIKYYSGMAVYHNRFDLPANPPPTTALFLDLGVLKNMARVRLNGIELGGVWCAPWRVDVSRAVRPVGNQLEITVVNTWPNRMIGDEQLPLDYERGADGAIQRLPDWLVGGAPRTSGRHTLSALSLYQKTDALLPSGLLGPVTLRSVSFER